MSSAGTIYIYIVNRSIPVPDMLLEFWSLCVLPFVSVSRARGDHSSANVLLFAGA